MSTGDRKLDEFESLFKSALHDVFHHRPPELLRVVMVSDLADAETQDLLAVVRRFLVELPEEHRRTWDTLPRAAWAEGDTPPIPRLFEELEARQADLVITPRALLGAGAGLALHARLRRGQLVARAARTRADPARA